MREGTEEEKESVREAQREEERWKMRRWEDVKMGKSEDVKMGRCEDVMMCEVHRKKLGYGWLRRLWRCGAALSAFLQSAKPHSFVIFMRGARVLLYCCLFYKACPAHPRGNGQELRLCQAIAISGNGSSRQLLFHEHSASFTKRKRGMYDFIWSQVPSRTCAPACIRNTLEKLLEEDVTTYQ